MKLNSGLPFSLIKSGLPYNYPKLEASIKTDVAIIGGGISGALCAYHLSEAGIHCVVIDKRTIGLGSTAASTSLLQYEIDTSMTDLAELRGEKTAVDAYRLCNDAVRKITSLCDRLHLQDFRITDSVYYAAHKKDEIRLKRECTLRRANGLDVQFLDSKELFQRFSINAPGAILSTNAAYADAYLLTHAILQYVKLNNVEVYDRTYVNKVVRSRSGVDLLTDDGNKIKAKHVIYATGYEATEIIKEKIVDLQSTFVTVSENLSNHESLPFKNTLIWNTADPYLYLRNTSDGRIIVGGRDEPFLNPTRRDNLIRSKTKALVNDFKKLYPSIAFTPEFSWAGTFGKTKDGLPYIGKYRDYTREYFALGFGGNGIIFSLIAAEIIRDSILGRNIPNAEIFSFNRF
jgi:glycine/D-amino acid oxidase-like deaminating enzyme